MPVGRRSLVKLALASAGLVPAYLSLRVLADFFQLGGAASRKRIYLGTIEEITSRLETGRASYYLDEKKKIVVVRDGKGPGVAAISVYSLVCTHLGCTLRPGRDDRFLECPCHGSRFHFLEPSRVQGACGQVNQGPATSDLKRYDVVAVKHRLYLEA